MKDPDATDVPSIIKKYALSSDEAQVIATIRIITGQSTANALHSLVRHRHARDPARGRPTQGCD